MNSTSQAKTNNNDDPVAKEKLIQALSDGNPQTQIDLTKALTVTGVSAASAATILAAYTAYLAIKFGYKNNNPYVLYDSHNVPFDESFNSFFRKNFAKLEIKSPADWIFKVLLPFYAATNIFLLYSGDKQLEETGQRLLALDAVITVFGGLVLSGYSLITLNRYYSLKDKEGSFNQFFCSGS